jgi:hypothetical protein
VTYGIVPPGTAGDRATAYVAAWTNRRGIDLARPSGFAALALSGDLKHRLRRRLTRSSLRKLPSLAPLLIGAGVGATLNRRDTRNIAEEIRADLRKRIPEEADYWSRALPA